MPTEIDLTPRFHDLPADWRARYAALVTLRVDGVEEVRGWKAICTILGISQIPTARRLVAAKLLPVRKSAIASGSGAVWTSLASLLALKAWLLSHSPADLKLREPPSKTHRTHQKRGGKA